MSYRIGDIVKVRVLYTYEGGPVTGLNSGLTLTAYNPAGSLITGGDVSSAEVANGFYDVSIAAASVLTAGVYSVAVVSSALPATLDSAWSYGQTEVDLVSKAGATQFDTALNSVGTFTVGSSSMTTSVITSAMSPAAAVTDQFKGRVLTFRNDTTTTNLRGQATDITGSSSGGVLTVTALTTAPVSGDKGVIS